MKIKASAFTGKSDNVRVPDPAEMADHNMNFTLPQGITIHPDNPLILKIPN